MIKLIIFDWDDVFTNGSIAGYYKCYHEALMGVDVHLQTEEETSIIKAYWGTGYRTELEHLLEKRPDLLEKAIKLYEQHMAGTTFIDCLTITPGAQDFLNDISKRYKLAIATGANPSMLKDRVMPKFRIPDVFAQIVTIYDIDDVAHAKPHPFMAQMIMQAQHVEPNETVLVGDAPNDMQMAWNAGIEPIAVLTGHLTKDEAEHMGVKRIIDNVTLLESELQRL